MEEEFRSKIQTQSQKLRSEIQSQSRQINSKIQSQSQQFTSKLQSQSQQLSSDIRSQSQRLVRMKNKCAAEVRRLDVKDSTFATISVTNALSSRTALIEKKPR